MDSTILELHIGLPWKDMQFEQNDYYLKGYLIRVIGCRFMDKILLSLLSKLSFIKTISLNIVTLGHTRPNNKKYLHLYIVKSILHSY